MKITFLGQSGFHIETEGHSILIDPFLSGNELAVNSPDEFSPSHIVLTHAHPDHYGDTEDIAKRSGATVVSSFEVINYLGEKDIQGHPMNVGGSHTFPFGKVMYTPAWHSNSLPDGTYAGMPSGLLLEIEGKRLYHAGDTALFSDMKLVTRGGVDLAMLPIGDNFTMGPEDALEAVKLIQPEEVIPVHYNTFEVIQQDPEAFKSSVESQTSSRCSVLSPGESTDL